MIDTSRYTQEYIRLGCPDTADARTAITDSGLEQSRQSRVRGAGFYSTMRLALSQLFSGAFHYRENL